jgi:hypothetical protein
MFLIFGDEADREQGRGQKFFVYGAVFAPTNSLAALHAQSKKLKGSGAREYGQSKVCKQHA